MGVSSTLFIIKPTVFKVLFFSYKNATLKLSYKLYQAFIIYLLLFKCLIIDYRFVLLYPCTRPRLSILNYENIYELIH